MIFWLNDLDFAILSFVTVNFMLAEVTIMGEQQGWKETECLLWDCGQPEHCGHSVRGRGGSYKSAHVLPSGLMPLGE